MLIAAILALAGVVIVALLNVLSGIPVFDFSLLTDVFGVIFPYLRQGILFMNTFCYANVVQALLAITVAVEGLLIDYKIVMWVATKIPMFGVSD